MSFWSALNPARWVQHWMNRREQDKLDLACYRRMRSRVEELDKWCGGDYPIIKDTAVWLLRGDTWCRGVRPKPQYHVTDGHSTVDGFREYLRHTYPRVVRDTSRVARPEDPPLYQGTYSPSESTADPVPPSGGSGVKRPPPTPFKFDMERPKPRTPRLDKEGRS